ncbi:MAG: hypothetical protein ACLP8X_35330 [Streptosporangiaceae bacterium]
MASEAEGDLPTALQWNRIIIYDPPPDWWLRDIDAGTQRELTVIRLETMQKKSHPQLFAPSRAATRFHPVNKTLRRNGEQHRDRGQRKRRGRRLPDRT